MQVLVAQTSLKREVLRKLGKPTPSPQVARCLIDTGASSTVIAPAILQRLELEPRGTVDIHTPSTGDTPHAMLTYDVALGFVFPSRAPTSGPTFFPVDPVQIVAADLSQQGIDGLVGRDILSLTVLVYDGSSGRGTISF